MEQVSDVAEGAPSQQRFSTWQPLSESSFHNFGNSLKRGKVPGLGVALEASCPQEASHK